jgi:site-specific recombinase XerD
MRHKSITFSIAIEKFVEAKRAERLSEHTLVDYKNTFRKFRRYLAGDYPVRLIKKEAISGFLANTQGVGKKTIRNYHAALSSLWNFLVLQRHVDENIVRLIKAPRISPKNIEPLSRIDVTQMLSTVNQRELAMRNRAILLLLLDCGLRASELCELQVRDIDLTNQHLFVRNGKGGKGRRIPFSEITKIAVENYMKSRKLTVNRPSTGIIFQTTTGNPINRNFLLKMVEKIGFISGVHHCHPHRFRHTFAIQFLRNGGNVYTLQALLGHSTLDMVKRYLAISQIDLERDHIKASPVVHWGL